MRSWFAYFSAGMAVVAFLAGRAEVARADVVVVNVNSNFFAPVEISVATGDTVCWLWVGGAHTTTSVDGLWDSGILSGAGSMFEYTFDSAGDYPYICTLHIDCCNMGGVVHVIDPVALAANLGASDVDPDATGAASYLMRPDRSTLDVMVGGVTSTNAVDVFVNGSIVGSIALDGTGSGELSLNSALGDMVPALQAGDEIEVFDATDDATRILVGTVQ